MESKKQPEQTVLHACDSDEKRPTVSNTTYQIIRHAAQNRNKKMSQGMVSYEILNMRYEKADDAFDMLEEQVNQDLRDYNIQPDNIDDITLSDKTDISRDGRTKTVRVWLPSDVSRSIQSNQKIHSIGHYLDRCTEKYINQPFSDRMNRISTKKEILNHIEHGSELSDIAKDIKEDADRFDIDSALIRKLNLDIDSISGYRKNKDLIISWEDRVNIYTNVTDKTDVSDIVDDLSTIHEIENEYYVEDKIRKHADMSRLSSTSSLPDIPNGLIGSAAKYTYDYTVDEIIEAYIQEDSIDKKNRLSISNLKKIYRQLTDSGEIEKKSFEDFIDDYISDSYTIDNSVDKTFAMIE